MSSYWKYYYDQPEYEGVLDFNGDTMSVTNNLIIKSNVSCQNLTCSNIFQTNLISTSIYASNTIRAASNVYIGNTFPTDPSTRISYLDSNMTTNSSAQLLIGQGPNAGSNTSLSYYKAINASYNVASLSCGVNNLQLYGGANALNGGSYSVLNSQFLMLSNVYMQSNLKIGYSTDISPSLFNCDIKGSLNVSSNLVCSNMQVVGNMSLPNALTVNSLTINSNLTCNKPATIRGVYVKDVFNENVSSMFRVTDTNNIDYIVSKNQCITNTLKYSKIIGIYDPLLGSNVPNGAVSLDITTIIDVDGKIPFSVLKGFNETTEGVAIGGLVLGSIGALLGLGIVATAVWGTFFDAVKNNAGVPLPGPMGPPGDQGNTGNTGDKGVGIVTISIQDNNFRFVLTDTSVILVPIPLDLLFTSSSFDTNVQRVINNTSLQGPTYDVGGIRERATESVRSSINTVRNTAQTAASSAQNTVRNTLRSGGRALANYGRSITNPTFDQNNGALSQIAENIGNVIFPG